jgi:hypothetical protein
MIKEGAAVGRPAPPLIKGGAGRLGYAGDWGQCTQVVEAGSGLAERLYTSTLSFPQVR